MYPTVISTILLVHVSALIHTPSLPTSGHEYFRGIFGLTSSTEFTTCYFEVLKFWDTLELDYQTESSPLLLKVLGESETCKTECGGSRERNASHHGERFRVLRCVVRVIAVAVLNSVTPLLEHFQRRHGVTPIHLPHFIMVFTDNSYTGSTAIDFKVLVHSVVFELLLLPPVFWVPGVTSAANSKALTALFFCWYCGERLEFFSIVCKDFAVCWANLIKSYKIAIGNGKNVQWTASAELVGLFQCTIPPCIGIRDKKRLCLNSEPGMVLQILVESLNKSLLATTTHYHNQKRLPEIQWDRPDEVDSVSVGYLFTGQTFGLRFITSDGIEIQNWLSLFTRPFTAEVWGFVGLSVAVTGVVCCWVLHTGSLKDVCHICLDFHGVRTIA